MKNIVITCKSNNEYLVSVEVTQEKSINIIVSQIINAKKGIAILSAAEESGIVNDKFCIYDTIKKMLKPETWTKESEENLKDWLDFNF